MSPANTIIITAVPATNPSIHAVSRFDGYSILKSVYQSDLLISGGGSLLQDVTSWKSMMYYLSIIGMGIFFRKKVFLYSQGIGPVRYHSPPLINKSD